MNKAELVKWLEKVPDEEPLFCLRGQDVLAPGTVRHWCQLYREEVTIDSPEERKKHNDALDCAVKMSFWKPRKLPD